MKLADNTKKGSIDFVSASLEDDSLMVWRLFMGTVIVLAVVLILVYFAIRSVVRDKKAGRCSGGCAGCGGGCGSCCHQESSDMNTSEKL